MAVPYYALIFLGGLYLRFMVGTFEARGAAEAPAPRVPYRAAEMRTLGVLAATAAL